MTVKIYGYVPGFGVPDISPFVTKVVNYMTFVGIPFEHVPQNLATLDHDAPAGKLPYIIDEDGTKVNDSSTILNYFKEKYGNALDGDRSAKDLADDTAWTRLVEENLYWSGIIEPRWRLDVGWETYVPIIMGGATPDADMRAALDAFRVRIMNGFNGQGMGRRTSEVVQDFFRADIDALSNFLGDSKYFTGDKLHAVDATVYSTLKHIALQPHPWPGTGYVQSKANLAAYIDRIGAEFGV